MPRRPRLYIPGVPAHIVQRGNNRQPCFFSEFDYQFYLETLRRGLNRYEVKCHAYVLMTNHVHLLLTPSTDTGISQLMSYLGKYYVTHINKTYRRTGTLWEGRHKSSLIDAESYLLRCYRYIELNPVRAQMVYKPDDYPWSSYTCNAWGKTSEIIEEHPLYRALARDAGARRYAYRALFASELDGVDIHAIRHATHYNYILGTERFKEKIEFTLGREVGYDARGRPRVTSG
jgi:REP-associated tyrosine transposase